MIFTLITLINASSEFDDSYANKIENIIDKGTVEQLNEKIDLSKTQENTRALDHARLANNLDMVEELLKLKVEPSIYSYGFSNENILDLLLQYSNQDYLKQNSKNILYNLAVQYTQFTKEEKREKISNRIIKLVKKGADIDLAIEEIKEEEKQMTEYPSLEASAANLAIKNLEEIKERMEKESEKD